MTRVWGKFILEQGKSITYTHQDVPVVTGQLYIEGVTLEEAWTIEEPKNIYYLTTIIRARIERLYAEIEKTLCRSLTFHAANLRLLSEKRQVFTDTKCIITDLSQKLRVDYADV